MKLNERSVAILQYLRETEDYTSINILSENFNVTDRTIRYDLDKIEKFLVKNGFGYLDREYGKGIRLKKDKKN